MQRQMCAHRLQTGNCSPFIFWHGDLSFETRYRLCRDYPLERPLWPRLLCQRLSCSQFVHLPGRSALVPKMPIKHIKLIYQVDISSATCLLGWRSSIGRFFSFYSNDLNQKVHFLLITTIFFICRWRWFWWTRCRVGWRSHVGAFYGAA